MTPVGETLRRERLKRNLDLEEISRELKISARFLKAIEDDQYDKLPGGVFAKSFVRQYARLLGLDEEQIAGQVQQSIAPLPEFAQLPDTRKARRRSPRFRCPRLTNGRPSATGDSTGPGGFPPLGLVAVMLVCSAVYTWMQHPKLALFGSNTPAPDSSAQTGSRTSCSARAGAGPTAPVPAESQPPADTRQTNPIRWPPRQCRAARARDQPGDTSKRSQSGGPKASPRARGQPRPRVPAGNVAVRVTITADEAVWVLARTDGKYAFSATMDANTTRTVEADQGSHAAAGKCGRRNHFAEWQADWSGRTQGPGANASVHLWRFPDRAGQAAFGDPDAAVRL